MDFIKGLPLSNGKNTILVVVDRLSKSSHFMTLAHPYPAKMVAEKFVEGVVKLHGMPRLPQSILCYQTGTSLVDEVDKTLASLNDLLKQLKANLHATTNRMKASHKLSSRFYGPYMVGAKIGAVAYKLRLSTGSRVHPVFYVTLLKKRTGDADVNNNELPLITDDGEFVMEPEAILDTRWMKKGSFLKKNNLSNGKSYLAEDATWENAKN
ncbi:uncharacterized protein LOC141665025 [Apium graveolens]|uniref:uncharacterized protein LOC141665025 n=1 Tax=Apium graveolens TaxID=4045 RepID=UPI003D7BEF62